MVPLRLLATLVLDIAVDDGRNAMLLSELIGLEDSVLDAVLEHVLVRRLDSDVVHNSVQQYTCPKTLSRSLWWSSVHLTCAKRSTRCENLLSGNCCGSFCS